MILLFLIAFLAVYFFGIATGISIQQGHDEKVKEYHAIPVDKSLTVAEAWKEICVYGQRMTYTGSETWAAVICDGKVCEKVKSFN